ncbi:MAG TPA: hypothetical protein VH186_05890 [Chloroflexia bacterium]|nr:hypothetical protein [Chloroflexia bacterium]
MLKLKSVSGNRPQQAKPISLNLKNLPLGSIFALGLALLAALQLIRAFTALFSPVVIDYSEMMVAGAAEQFRLSGNLGYMYAPPTAPYGMPGVQYPPLFILLTAGLNQLSGWGVILSERLLAWGLYVASGGLVGLIVGQETGRKWVAWVSAGIPFCFWGVIIFVHAGRVDPLALFLSLLAAFLYRRARLKQKLSFGWLVGISLLASAAFFSKQTYLAVNAAIFFDLLFCPQKQPLSTNISRLKALRPNLKWAFGYALLFVAWTGFGLLLVGIATDRQFFGIFEPARAGSFILQRVPGFISIFLLDHLPLLVLAGWMIFRQWRRGERFWPLYTLFAALACVTIIKDGAVDYYFNELSYVLSVSVGLAIAEARKKGLEINPVTLKHWQHHTLVALALLIQLGIALGMLLGWSHWRDFDLSKRAYNEGLSLVRMAYAEEAQGGKPPLVLVDSFLLETGRARQVADYFIYSVLLTNGKRDPAALVADLDVGHYGMVITENFLRWPPSVEAALNKRYNLHIIYGDDGRKPYYVYTLRDNGKA